jgi:hypothetical protein
VTRSRSGGSKVLLLTMRQPYEEPSGAAMRIRQRPVIGACAGNA